MSEWRSSKRTQITNVGKDVEEREPLYTVGRNINWYSHYGKQYGGFPKSYQIELQGDSAILLLGVYPKDTKKLIQKDTCTPMIIAALFTTAAKIQKQPKCPSTDEWTKKMCNTHTYIHTHIHTYTQRDTHIRTHTHTYTYTNTHTHTHTRTHTHIHRHTCMHAHIHTHTYTLIHINTHIDTHTHTQTHRDTHTQAHMHTHTHRDTHRDTHIHTDTHRHT